MVGEQEQDRPDGELGKVNIPFLCLDEAYLLCHLGQLEPGVTLHEADHYSTVNTNLY